MILRILMNTVRRQNLIRLVMWNLMYLHLHINPDLHTNLNLNTNPGLTINLNLL